jgi:ubiquinone/menaquinone biosynthesis C-methylase UbiE
VQASPALRPVPPRGTGAVAPGQGGAAPAFDNAAAYDAFMAPWSAAAAAVFLDWLSPALRCRWLDVGCGTGALTRVIADRCDPTNVDAVDTEPAQIDHARRGFMDRRVTFGVADARSLPFADAAFDLVASGLMLNFVPNPASALRDMRRVTRRGGRIAAYVWDFGNDMSPSGPLRASLRRCGVRFPDIPGTRHATTEALARLFRGAGLAQVATTSMMVEVTYPDFQSFWTAQISSHGPTTPIIAAMSAKARAALADAVRCSLPAQTDGRIRYAARAHAIQGRVADTRA